ncbi:unnamed protein product [Vitrella brassicaformis CCMP3155]|uniref:Peroxisomal membrane protein PEX16 n=3 Tax=Vitrella brassicaformis TaxID=1169539 RepID=A0A0G4FQU9_VITBC|nr:unnamed protein product [Vitrella brassicaformis CCMP3155]|eukprot:CEM16827.1 unnamed protein product [Vitrella brassicaformis CCMP3155]
MEEHRVSRSRPMARSAPPRSQDEDEQRASSPPAVASPPRSLWSAHKAFMQTWGGQLEEWCRLLLYLLPVEEADPATETRAQLAYSAVDLFSLYRESVQAPATDLPVLARLPNKQKIAYVWLSLVLRSLRCIQVLLEMWESRRHGFRASMRLCFKIECVKLVLRVAIQQLSPFGLYVDEECLWSTSTAAHHQLEPHSQHQSASPSAPAHPASRLPWVGRRTGRTIRELTTLPPPAPSAAPPPAPLPDWQQTILSSVDADGPAGQSHAHQQGAAREGVGTHEGEGETSSMASSTTTASTDSATAAPGATHKQDSEPSSSTNASPSQSPDVLPPPSSPTHDGDRKGKFVPVGVRGRDASLTSSSYRECPCAACAAGGGEGEDGDHVDVGDEAFGRRGRYFVSEADLKVLFDQWMAIKDMARHAADPSRRGLVLGEALFHLRPLLHSFLLSQGGDKPGWMPWVIALGMDLVSSQCLHGHARRWSSFTPFEMAELQRRRSALSLALVRSPFFDKFLEAPCVQLDHVIKRIPFLSLISALDTFLALRPYFFSTSGS